MNNVMLELTRITQEVAQAETPEAQVQIIVDAISEVIQIDVCSLYIKNENNDMALLASHGLTTHLPIIIPMGKGIVGLVAQSRHTINMVDPEKHPDYFYVAQSNEEKFHSFCGVPLVFRGDVIGVLTVQSCNAVKLGSEQEAFLTTLASHLALLTPNLPKQKTHKSSNNLRYLGLSGASGIAIGTARLSLSVHIMDAPEKHSENPTQELTQWHELHAAVVAEIQKERNTVEKTLGEGLASIIDAYQMLLADPTFINRVEDEINAGKNLLTAIKHTIHYFSELFRSMDDPYLRARHEDINHLGDKLYQSWLGKNVIVQTSEIDGPIILIGNHISVSDIVSLPTDKLAGIVCIAGAALSHIAVFANALGIPAVMGVGELKDLEEGEPVIVDGNTGHIIRRPTSPVIDEYQAIVNTRMAFDRQLHSLCALPATTTDGAYIELLANSGLQADVMPGIQNGADGIGLYRTEIPFMIRSSLPSEDEQVDVYQHLFHAYANKPVYIRTLDIGGDKPLPYLPIMKEENPALGWRGVRFTLDNLQLMIAQLRAIIRAAEGRDDIHILLPMVSSTAELDRCIALLDDACQQLVEEGITVQRPKMGIMIEVPAAISLLPFLHDKLDFISIGSNDLSQYLLAIDRNNPLVGKFYEPLHPAVIHEIHRIVNIAEKFSLPISLCGELASDPVAVMLLIGLGVRRFSLSSSKLPLIKWIIRSISLKDAKSFSQQALEQDNASAIRKLGISTLSSLGIEFNAAQPILLGEISL
jgi:phosphotransferase system enzyme I (PtsI)/phosphotransferase system enzyme I (PtsP)